jgi:hypothetical protein
MKDILGRYLGHLAGYIVATATIVSGLDPKLVPPQYAFLTAVAGTIVAASHHGYTAGVTGAAVKAAADAATSAITSTPAKIVAMILLANAIPFIGGCTTLPTPTQQAGITVAVDIATGAAIQNGGNADIWKARAIKFKAIATSVKQVNDAGTATLATLMADLTPQLALLPPADQLAAHALVAALQPYLDQEIAANPDLAKTRAALDVILQAVIDSCNAYGAGSTVTRSDIVLTTYSVS